MMKGASGTAASGDKIRRKSDSAIQSPNFDLIFQYFASLMDTSRML